MTPFLCSILLLSTPLTYRVSATLDTRKQKIAGSITTATLPAGVHLFWTYPNRFRKPPPWLNDLNRYRVYPVMFDKGGMRVALSSGGKKIPVKWFPYKWMGRAGFTVQLSAPARLSIAFTTTVPTRYGPFGCVHSSCILGGPWYPQYGGLISGKAPYKPRGEDLRPFNHQVSLKTVQKRMPLFLGGAGRGSRKVSGKALFFPAAAGADYKISCKKRFCIFHLSSYRSPFRFLTGERIFEVEQSAQKSIQKIKNFPKGFTMWLLEANLMEELTMTLPGGVMLFAQKSFSVFPIRYFLRFHRQAIARGVLETWLTRKLNASESATGMRWVPEMIAAYASRFAKSVRGLLEVFEWIPQIDLVLKNPRMEFRSAFFQSPADRDAMRDDYRRWNTTTPAGQRLFYKLLDLFGEKELGRIIAAYLTKQEPFETYIASSRGLDLSWFFKMWLAGEYRVNYFVKGVKYLGRNTAGRRYRITLGKRSSRRIREPVEVQITGSGGEEVTYTWNGFEKVHRFEVTLRSFVKRVEIDPEGRLDEKSQSDNPLYDNVWPSQEWRFIFSGFKVLFNVTEMLNKFYMDMDFLPRNSLRHRVNLLTYRDEIIEGGAQISYLSYFGNVVNKTRLAWRWDNGIGAGYTRAIMGPDNTSRAIKYSAYTSLVFNNREDFMLPTKKGWALLLASVNSYTYDHTSEGTSTNMDLFAEGSRYFKLPLGMTLAAHAKGGMKVGKVHDEVELFRLTGPGFVQGYEVDAFPGRAMILGALEVRHMVYPSSDLTILGAVNLTRVSGALYVGAGAIAGGIEGSYFDDRRWAAGIGYGLRLHGKWFGVYEGIINLQVAWPLKKYAHTREPFIFFISLEPIY